MKKCTLLAILAVFAVFLFPGFCVAEEAVLTWDKPADIRVMGYNVYVGDSEASAVLPASLNGSVDDPDICTYLITDLTAGQHIFVTATSFDAEANESAFSTIIDAIVPDLSPPDVIVYEAPLGGIQVVIEFLPPAAE